MFAIFLHEGMDPFYQNIASFPTVVFTFFLGICVLFWLVAVLGFVEIDLFDFDIPDGGVHHDVGLELSDANVLAGLALRFGLHGVPVTIILSLMSLIGWLVSYYTVHFVFFLLPGDILRYVVGLGVVIAATFIAAMITSVLIKPLRPIFQKARREAVKHVLGQTAVVRTSRVDSSFGEAVLDDGGAGLILKVRASGDTAFKKGDRVVLFEHLKAENIYRVVSQEEFSG